MIYHLGLGSNQGNSLAHMLYARQELQTLGILRGVAPLYQTAPQSEIAQKDYLNSALILETFLKPYELLAATQNLERLAGRTANKQRNAPRPLDIDILLAENCCINEQKLCIPHPRLTERHFVLAPLLALDADLRLPDGRALRCFLAAVRNQAVRLIDEPSWKIFNFINRRQYEH